MKRHQFKLECPGGKLGVESIYLDTYPRAGDTLTLFNFPYVEQFRIERLEPRPDWFARDWFEPMALVLRLNMVLQTAAPKNNIVPFNQDIQIDTRLNKIEKIARKTIVNGLKLEISHRDFVALCLSTGLSADVEGVDAFAYHDIPMTIGAPGEIYNAATSFSGFSNELHTLYVTWPCGAPFVMNGKLFDLAKDFYACQLSTDMALGRALAIAVDYGIEETEGLEENMRKILSAMGDGLLPIYDGAQALTQMTLPSYAAALKRIRAEQPREPAPEGTRYGSAGLSANEVAILIEALSGGSSVRH